MSVIRSPIRSVIRSVIRTVIRGASGGRWFGLGNGTRRIVSPVITYTDGFSLPFTFQRKDKTGTGQTALFGDNAATTSAFIINDTNSNDALLIIGGVTKTIANAFAGVALDSVAVCSLDRVGNTSVVTLTINGASAGTFTTASGDFVVSSWLAYNGGANASKGYMANVGGWDTSKFLKGNYLKADGTIVCLISAPLLAGQSVDFNYSPVTTAAFDQCLFGMGTSGLPLQILKSSNVIKYNTSFVTNVKVDGTAIASATYVVTDGVSINITCDLVSDRTVTGILSNTSLSRVCRDGAIANFNLNNGEYIYPLNNIIDNGDTTATAPNTGSASGADGTIASYDAATNVFTSAGRLISYPANEESGLGVLAYDDNGDTWAAKDAAFTPDSDRQFL